MKTEILLLTPGLFIVRTTGPRGGSNRPWPCRRGGRLGRGFPDYISWGSYGSQSYRCSCKVLHGTQGAGGQIDLPCRTGGGGNGWAEFRNYISCCREAHFKTDINSPRIAIGNVHTPWGLYWAIMKTRWNHNSKRWGGAV